MDSIRIFHREFSPRAHFLRFLLQVRRFVSDVLVALSSFGSLLAKRTFDVPDGPGLVSGTEAPVSAVRTDVDAAQPFIHCEGAQDAPVDDIWTERFLADLFGAHLKINSMSMGNVSGVIRQAERVLVPHHGADGGEAPVKKPMIILTLVSEVITNTDESLVLEIGGSAMIPLDVSRFTLRNIGNGQFYMLLSAKMLTITMTPDCAPRYFLKSSPQYGC